MLRDAQLVPEEEEVPLTGLRALCQLLEAVEDGLTAGWAAPAVGGSLGTSGFSWEEVRNPCEGSLTIGWQRVCEETPLKTSDP